MSYAYTSERVLGLLGIFFLLTLYYFFSNVEQADFVLMFVLVSMLFGIYLLFAFKKISGIGLKLGLATALLARVMTLFFFPNLSDDIYRFIWDGMCWREGINPFALTPAQLMESIDLNLEYKEIFPFLNSKDYFTIYPPICQVSFWLATISPADISPNLILKSIFLLSEIATIYIVIRLCDLVSIDRSKVLIYALNPLIIIELCGNLHFEALMVTFLALTFYYLRTNRFKLSGMAYGLAVSTKLVPLVFGPILLFFLGIKKGLRFFIPAGIVTIFSFGLMLREHVSSILASTNLYFQKFEFNASIYYAAREIGWWWSGYNRIGTLGPALALVAFILILYYSFKRNDINFPILLNASITIFTCYLLFSTTIHPWYLSTLVLLSVFSSYRFAILWTFLIFLSYSAYQFKPTEEIGFLLMIEYGLVGLFGYYEFNKKSL